MSILVCSAATHAHTAENGPVRWSELPPLPDAVGFAGMFAGVSDDALVVAGGANFPDLPPWQGGVKVWHDRIFVLENPAGVWRVADEKLPRPLAYGVSVTHGDRVICVGGGDAERHYREVFALWWDGKHITIDELPPLPQPCAFACGAVVGDTLYVAGGIDRPNATQAMHNFWSLDLTAPAEQAAWRELPAWPGPERQLAVAAVNGDSFFLISGVQLRAGADDKPERLIPFLSDAFRYDPKTEQLADRWTKLPSAPRGVAAAPSPALSPCHCLLASSGTPSGECEILILGGDDGSLFHLDPQQHPGFKREMLKFDTAAGRWTVAGQMPEDTSRVTAPTTVWRGGWVLVSGESQPGIRSPKVFWLKTNAAEIGASR